MVGLTAVGTLKYNGVTFDGTSNVKIVDLMEYDEADRTMVMHHLRIEVKAVVAATSETLMNTNMDLIRFKLSEPGKELIIKNRGFGKPIVINGGGSGATNDLKLGPKPRMVSWEPIAGQLAADVEWHCETWIAVCNTAGVHARHSGITEMNYEISYSVNERGFTTRTINGHLEVVVERNGVVLTQTADQYRERIAPPKLAGFHRTNDWHLTADKKRVFFAITDRQIESKFALPAGVSDASGNHRVAWSRGNNGAMILRNNVSMSLTLNPNVPPATGYVIFGQFIKGRMDAAKKKGKYSLIDEVVINEDIWGFASDYSASWRVLSSLKEILDGSQIWLDPGYRWPEWARSMEKAQDPRGWAGLIYSPNQEALIGPCGGATIRPIGESIKPLPRQSKSKPPKFKSIQNEKPPEKESWLSWFNKIVPFRWSPTVRQASQQKPEQVSGSQKSTGSLFSFPVTKDSETIPDRILKTGANRYAVTIVGGAERAGHSIPRPALIQVGSQAAVERNTVFEQEIVGNYFGVPVYRARWSIEYDLAKSPGAVKVLEHIQQGVGADGQV